MTKAAARKKEKRKRIGEFTLPGNLLPREYGEGDGNEESRGGEII